MISKFLVNVLFGLLQVLLVFDFLLFDLFLDILVDLVLLGPFFVLASFVF